ncbi:unnamed protein product [Nesidiocoris tenuis]|nr:unnamed protein product [Nesidiocoris tenuis]CAB0009274.1 unnamed protein product [Nesidiocoris tenuis]
MAVSVRGLYPKGGIPSHSCVSNTTYSILPDNYMMVMRATVDLKKGSEILCTYTTILDPTMIRRWYLKRAKYFDCDCARCKDPKELGTHLSSIKCPACDNGLILSSDPLDKSAEWKCDHCDKTLPGETVQRLYFAIRTDLSQLEELEIGPIKLEMTEKVLRKYRSSLHPRHGFNLALMHSLVDLYGKVDGYTVDMLPDILLERKAEFAQNILDALDIVKPGMTRMRGRILFEQHVCYLMMARTQLQLRVVTLEKFKEQINKVIAMLEETARILEVEPEGSADRMMAQSARGSIAELQASLDNMTELPE